MIAAAVLAGAAVVYYGLRRLEKAMSELSQSVDAVEAAVIRSGQVIADEAHEVAAEIRRLTDLIEQGEDVPAQIERLNALAVQADNLGTMAENIFVQPPPVEPEPEPTP